MTYFTFSRRIEENSFLTSSSVQAEEEEEEEEGRREKGGFQYPHPRFRHIGEEQKETHHIQNRLKVTSQHEASLDVNLSVSE